MTGGAKPKIVSCSAHCIRTKLSKYDSLTAYLEGLTTSSCRMRFDEIEQVLQFNLPKSARTYPAWWQNESARPGRQCRAWINAGFVTEQVDLAGEAVTFRRSDSTPIAKAKRRPKQRKHPPTASSALSASPGGRIDVSIDMQWKQLGMLALDQDSKLAFPDAPTAPALYRLRLIGPSGTRHYVGEAVNLKRRFGNYRNPGPTQATSLRINDLLLEHLRAGDEVVVDTILSGMTLLIAGKPATIDLSDKATRRLLEQAALVADHATDIDSLNR